MQNRCQNCGSTKIHIDGKYYVCDFCGEKILKESLNELIKKDSKFIDDYVMRNEKLFSINFNDETLTKEGLYKLANELKQNINDQQDENSKALKEGILADIYEKISSIIPKKQEPNEDIKDYEDFISKVNKCTDLEDLIDKGNALRRRIEKSFYKAEFKNLPLFKKVKGKAAITKERYCEFVDFLLNEGKISESDAWVYKKRVNNNQVQLISNDPLNRVSADMKIRFLATGLNFSDASKACRDWGLLNTCSHEGAEDMQEVKKVFLPIDNGKEYLKKLYIFYRNRNIVD